MLPQLIIPRTNLELNPIIITSPIVRSGTTLLQRLITSAPNGMIFGENAANEIQFFMNYFTTRQLFFAQGKHHWDAMRQMVERGDVNEWIADLLPPIDNYLDKLGETCFNMAQFYKGYANQQGATVWGVKIAGWNLPALRLMRLMMPGSKILYIFRDPVDCIKSAWATNMIQAEEDMLNLAKMYSESATQLLDHFQHGELYFINYQELISNPEKVIAQLESITGASGIDPSVMEHRINTFKGDTQRDPSGQGTIPPAELSESDMQKIREIADPVFQRMIAQKGA
ncbi:MAG: sulfotransferase [Bacteroidia bacterium]|nr:sulfotransferase [Bacteroidia bacterium]